MNGRTCQLCGKALSRFTVGSGGDFCSREHRNQFRLRLGMDRLMEANKVASLMRRRENAKAIPAAQLARDTKVSQRIAPLVRMPVRQPDPYSPAPLQAVLERPKISPHSATPRSAARPATAIVSEVRAVDPHAFRPRSMRPLLPPRADSLEAHIAPAGAVLVHAASACMAQLRREVTELRLNLQRTHIGGSGIQVRPLHLASQNCQEPQPARRLNNSADRGVELRVSGGIGFRLIAPRIRPLDFAAPRTNPPVRATRPRELPMGSRPRKSDTVSSGIIRFAVRIPAAPAVSNKSNGASFQFPDLKINGTGRPRRVNSGARSCDVRWMTPAPCPPQLRHTNGVVRLRPLSAPVPSLSVPEPRAIPSTHRLTLVSFQPQETLFECPTALHGTLLSSTPFGAAPLRKVEAPLPTLEEHFDSGLNNWVGGVADWKVDVAGVRPGSLALYSPSVELPNYQLEFLTRIEQRGMTWVFRAANLQDYYKATLATAPGGGYEFRRCAVIAGAAGDVTVRSIPPASPAPTGKTAVTVRTRVAGDEFTVSIDGQVIDTWTDARLTAGGIGFVGAPEDRARLYWVKVTPIGHISKEYSKR